MNNPRKFEIDRSVLTCETKRPNCIVRIDGLTLIIEKLQIILIKLLLQQGPHNQSSSSKNYFKITENSKSPPIQAIFTPLTIISNGKFPQIYRTLTEPYSNNINTIFKCKAFIQ